MKYAFVIAILSIMPFQLFGQGPIPVPAEEATVDLERVVAEVLANNPELQAFNENRRVAAARIPQMGALDDPMFNFEIEEAPSSAIFNSSQWKYVNFQLTQSIPFPGKLSNKQTIAEFNAEHALHDYQEKMLEVIDKVKTAYYELYYAQRAMEVNQENTRLLEQFAQTAKTRYAVGKATNQDVLKANVEVAKLANERIALNQKEETAKAMLNVLLNRLPQAPLGKTFVDDGTTKVYELEKLQELALQTRPMVKHDSLGIVQSEVNLALAKKQYLPDFNAGIKYVRSPLDGFRGWTAMVGISLPFSPWTLGKRSGQVEEATADIQMKRAM